MVFRTEDLILNFDRIRSSATDFIRSNPITTTAIALGVPLTFIGISSLGKRVVAKRRKKTTTKKRKKKSGRRKTTTRRARPRKRKTHRSPRHRGHKRVSFTTADGKKVNFLVRKKGSKKHRR